MQNNSTPSPTQTNNDPNQFGDYSNWAKQEMAKGYTPDELHQTLQSSGVSDYGQGQSAPQSGNGGNWFTHILPTIGGLAGGALGTLTDVFDGPLGTIGGSAAGSGLGKALENALEGKNALDASDLGAAAEGAVGAGVGGIVGKGLGLAGKAATGRIESLAAKQGANDVANAYGDVPKPIQSLYNADNSISHVRNLGYNPADPQNLVHVGTTSNDILNEALNNSLAKSGPVNLGNYSATVRQALAEADPNGTYLGSIEPVSVRGSFSVPNTTAAKLVAQLDGLGKNVASEAANPTDVRTLVDSLGQLSQKLAPKVNPATGSFDPAQEAAYNTVNSIRQKLSSTLYNRPEVNQALKAVQGNIQAGDVGGSQALADHLNGVFNTAGTDTNTPAQDFLDHIGRNNDITALGNEGLKAGQIVTSPTAQARAAGTAANAGQQGLKPADVLKGAAAGHAVVSGIASHGIIPAVMGVAKAGSNVINNPSILDTLGRISALGTKTAPVIGGGLGTAPNLGAAPVNQPQTAVGGGAMNNNAQTPTNPNGSMTIGDYLGSLERMSLAAPSLAAGLAPTIATLAQVNQKNQAANSILGSLNAAYNNAGGAQGTSGVLSNIAGMIPGTAQNTYQNERNAASSAVAPLLGISPEAARGLTPGFMQNANSAGLNQSILSQLSGQLGY